MVIGLNIQRVYLVIGKQSVHFTDPIQMVDLLLRQNAVKPIAFNHFLSIDNDSAHTNITPYCHPPEKQEYHGGPGVIGYDIAGPEAPFPPLLFTGAYALAAKMGLKTTVHAGESEGPERIWEAIDGQRSVDQIVDQVCDTFDVKRRRAQKDVLKFLRSLQRQELIQSLDGGQR